jgi:hypothetical protein
LGVARAAFHRHVQRLEVGVYDVWHAHLLVVGRELQDVFPLFRHFRALRLLADTQAVFFMAFEELVL